MPDLTNCRQCARLIDEPDGSLCDTCTDQALDRHMDELAEREIAALALPGGIDHSDYLARMGIDEGPTDDELIEEEIEMAAFNASNDEALPFDGPVEDKDYPSATPRGPFGLTQDQEAELQDLIDVAEVAYSRSTFNTGALEAAEDAIFAYVNNHLQLRDTELELLKMHDGKKDELIARQKALIEEQRRLIDDHQGVKPMISEAQMAQAWEQVQREQSVIEALRKIDTTSISPLEALTKLSELKRMAGKA